MKKSLAFLLIVTTFVSFTFVGCRKKTPPPDQKDYSGVELTYYKVFDEADVIEPLLAEFEAEHPGLKINYKKFSDFDEYQRTVLNEMAEGEGPDVFSMQNTWFATNFKKLAPMPESFGGPEDFAETFVDVAYKDLVHVDVDGTRKIFGMPMTVDTLALYYNKEHFEDRLPSKGKPSSTWEGIKEDVVALNKEDNSFDRFEVSGIAMGRGDNIDRAVDILYLLFLQYGVKFYDDQIAEATFAGKHDGNVSFPAISALELFVGFADPDQKHYSWNEFVVDDDSDEQEIKAFAEGKVSMIIGYAYTYDLVLNQISVLDSVGQATIDKSAIRVAPVPQLYDPEVSTEKRVTYASYFAETVSRNSEHPDLAWELLLFLTSKDVLDEYFEETHNPTSRRDMISDQSKDPIYGVFASQIGYAESFPILEYYSYKGVFEDLINRANNEGVNKSGLSDAQDLINEMIPKEGFVYEEIIKDPDEEADKEEEDVEE